MRWMKKGVKLSCFLVKNGHDFPSRGKRGGGGGFIETDTSRQGASLRGVGLNKAHINIVINIYWLSVFEK